jgi:hypothetical protein
MTEGVGIDTWMAGSSSRSMFEYSKIFPSSDSICSEGQTSRH